MSSHRLWIGAIAAAALVFGSSVGCSTTALVRPTPVSTTLAPKGARAAILKALPRRGWIVDHEEPGAVFARYQRRAHAAVVRVGYGDGQVTVDYVSSENLKCTPAGDSCSSIHKVYNAWAQNLANDLAAEISAAEAAAR